MGSLARRVVRAERELGAPSAAGLCRRCGGAVGGFVMVTPGHDTLDGLPAWLVAAGGGWAFAHELPADHECPACGRVFAGDARAERAYRRSRKAWAAGQGAMGWPACEVAPAVACFEATGLLLPWGVGSPDAREQVIHIVTARFRTAWAECSEASCLAGPVLVDLDRWPVDS